METWGYNEISSFIKMYVLQFSPLTTILHSVSTRDTEFLYHSQSKHILGEHGANHNIFGKQSCPTADSPSTGSSRVSITVEGSDTVSNSTALLDLEIQNHWGGKPTHSCSTVWRWKKCALRGGANKMTQNRWDRTCRYAYVIWSRSMKVNKPVKKPSRRGGRLQLKVPVVAKQRWQFCFF